MSDYPEPIYVAFYTLGTLYEREADRLRKSLDLLGLPHDIVGVESRGDWQANAAHTATFSCLMLDKYPLRPVVQLDADAVVWRIPAALYEVDADVAVHYRKGRELLNGTVYWAPTPGARRVAERYRELVALAGNNCHNEQRMLQRALEELAPPVRVARLGPELCCIFDLMREDLPPGAEPVIEHLQASRESHPSEYTERRRRRLAEIEG